MIDVELVKQSGELFDGRYKLLKTLSTDGGSADVWLAIDVYTIDNPNLLNEDSDNKSLEESGMLVAIKIYRPKNALDIEGEQRFRDEYKIVHNCRHTNLLQPNNFSIWKETPYLELPYCKNGSSELLIGKDLKEKEIWKFMFDVSSGLSYLHACNPPIIHQDVKPANVLIDDYNNYAITDFGISAQRGTKHDYLDEENSGTMAYMAPERFKENYMPTAESDMWAFGATLYEILTGRIPYGEEGGKNQLEDKIKLEPFGNKIPKDIQKIILSCLSLNPKDRPTANQIIKTSQRHINSSGKIVKYIRFILLFVIVIVGILIFKPEPDPKPIKETYNKAIELLDSKSPSKVKKGVGLMNDLALQNYAPAMYELAKTYGWFSDKELLQRKEALDIEYYKDKIHFGMPTSDKYNDKARDIYAKILDLNDPSAVLIKAHAAYRMSTYSANENNIYGQNFKKAKQYLLLAKKYALEASNDSLLEIINKSIDIIDKRINK